MVSSFFMFNIKIEKKNSNRELRAREETIHVVLAIRV